MTHRERTAELTTSNHAVLDALAASGDSYRELARNLLRQMAWAQDKMERSEKLCKDPWDRAHLRTVKQALVFNHPLLKKDRKLIMELNPHVSLDAATRKATPVCSGVLDYFPDALLEVARVSRVGNDQHNPGQPLHWDKSKSTDEADALVRHLLDRGKTDSDGLRHTAKAAWRALALLQREIDAERADVSDAPRKRADGLTSLPTLMKHIKLMMGSFADGDVEVPKIPYGYELVTEGKVQNGDIMVRAGAGETKWEPIRPLLVRHNGDVAEGRSHGTFVARAVDYLAGRRSPPGPISFEMSDDRLERDYRPLRSDETIEFGDIVEIHGVGWQTASGVIGCTGWNARRPLSRDDLPTVVESEPAFDADEETPLPERKQGRAKARRWRSAPKGHILTTKDRIKIGNTWEQITGLAGCEVDSHGRLDSSPVQVLA